MEIPDTGVWYYKETGTSELRYSIRSAIKNLSLKRVIVVGDKPSWFVETQNSIYVKSETKREHNWDLAWVPWTHMENFLRSGVYKGEFLLFNDDFFVLQPLCEWKDFHRDQADYDAKCGIHNRVYHIKELRAFRLLGISEFKGKHFNLHMPMRMNTNDLEKAVAFWNSQPNKAFEFRTTYGNMFLEGTIPHRDVKYDSNGIFYSSGDKVWVSAGKYIREAFADKTFCER